MNHTHDLNRTGLVVCSIFSRKGAKAARNFDVSFVLTPNTFACFAPWRDYICFFLSQRRQGRQELRCLFCFTRNTFACSAPLRDYICFFLSLRRRGRRELQCLFCFYPKHLCVLCALARVYLFFSLAEAQRPQRTSMFILFSPQTPLRTLRLGES